MDFLEEARAEKFGQRTGKKGFQAKPNPETGSDLDTFSFEKLPLLR